MEILNIHIEFLDNEAKVMDEALGKAYMDGSEITKIEVGSAILIHRLDRYEVTTHVQVIPYNQIKSCNFEYISKSSPESFF